jgi:integrase
MRTGKLIMRKVESAKPWPNGRPRWLGDGGGLWVVTGVGTQSWVYRYQLNGRARYMGIGATADVGLAEAREKARRLRAQVHRKPEDGGAVDVLEARREAALAQKIERAQGVTFRAAAEAYLKANVGTWKNAKHRQQWVNTLATYAHPYIGDWPIQKVDTAACVTVLAPIWHAKPETARRVRMRVETIIEWAIAARAFAGDNPAKLERLKHLLGKQTDTVEHHAAIPYAELGAFVAALRKFDGVGALPLEFNLLTATRTSETLLANWSEFDLENALWTIAAHRRKGPKGKESALTVPLSRRCVAILEELGPQPSGLVFTNPGGRRLSENSLSSTMRQLGRSETVHGTARSAFRDWCGDRTSFPREIAEAALGHTITNDVEAAYRRGSAIEKRRSLMQAWADYLDAPPAGGGTVVPIRA